MAALRKTLTRRISYLAKICSIPSPTTPAAAAAGEEPGLLRRFLQKRPIFQPALPPDRLPFLPAGEVLSDRIRSLNQNRIRLDCLAPPPQTEDDQERRITVEEAKKVLRASQMEAVRARLRAVPSTCLPYTEFVRICGEESGGAEPGSRIARSLDESGSVIVLGETVFLRPELVMKAIQNMVPQSTLAPNDPRREELKAMEAKKAEIDRRAAAQVRRELWCGLGYLIVQTVGFMRLTFWELSWDVMEPICFYVTSFYFMAGYAFFLRTSKEPSFEGFFESRFAAKQKKLMKANDFDPHRFHELKKAFGLPPLPSPPHDISPSPFCRCH